MKVIIDTNLWISFLIGKKLTTLKKLFTDRQITIYTCPKLVEEIMDVASRPKIIRYVKPSAITALLEIIHSYCKHVTVTIEATSTVRDENDRFLLSLAETIQADYIITGDKDLLCLGKHKRTQIVTFNEFFDQSERK